MIYGNVANDGPIDDLPAGCTVEVPGLVDGNGVQPTAIGALPPQLAALIRTNVNVQELTVEAALPAGANTCTTPRCSTRTPRPSSTSTRSTRSSTRCSRRTATSFRHSADRYGRNPTLIAPDCS